MLRKAIEKRILLGPAPVRRAVAARVDRETAWMLRQSRAVRESYVREVLEAEESTGAGSLR